MRVPDSEITSRSVNLMNELDCRPEIGRIVDMKESTNLCLVVILSIETVMAFKFVYIPCDRSAPMDEWNLHAKDKDDEIGCLTTHLQKWYARAGRLTEDQKQNFKGHLRMHASVSVGLVKLLIDLLSSITLILNIVFQFIFGSSTCNKLFTL